MLFQYQRFRTTICCNFLFYYHRFRTSRCFFSTLSKPRDGSNAFILPQVQPRGGISEVQKVLQSRLLEKQRQKFVTGHSSSFEDHCERPNHHHHQQQHHVQLQQQLQPHQHQQQQQQPQQPDALPNMQASNILQVKSTYLVS